MNIDAITVANYFWKVPTEVYEALVRIMDSESDKDALILANYINEIPENILASLKRILKIEV